MRHLYQPSDDAEWRRRIKKRGIVLATAGLFLALAVILGLEQLGIARVSARQWIAAAGLTLAVQTVLWLVPHLGLSERISWDPHYLIIPMTAAALLLGFYTYLAPGSRYLLLMAWFVALIFMAGLADFTQVLTLGSLMAASWLGALGLRMDQGAGYRMSHQIVQAGVFLAIHVYAGLVFEQLRRDRRETKDLRRRLAEQALTDPLTGVPNRRYFEEFLRSELARIDRYGGSCAVAMLDVDHFKNYNDTLGHMAGDEVLQELADLFTRLCRESDVVARYGGEEFAVVMPNTTRSEATESIERLRRLVEESQFRGENIQPTGQLTISAGIAGYPGDAGTYDELVRAADRSLYVAKNRGRNRVHGGNPPPAGATATG